MAGSEYLKPYVVIRRSRKPKDKFNKKIPHIGG